MEVKILKVDNGYVVNSTEDITEDISVFEESDDPLWATENLLWFVLEVFGKTGSKHDFERLVVKRVRREG